MHTVSSYSVFVVSGFVALVVDVVVFLLQVELDPVVKTRYLPTIFGFSDKHVFKSTGILTTAEVKQLFSDISLLHVHLFISFKGSLMIIRNVFVFILNL